MKLSRFCFFLRTRLHVTFINIIFFHFCFCFKWVVQVINFNLLKRNRRCKVIHNDIQRKFLLQNFCLRLLSYSILHHILHFSVHKTFFTFMNARILSLKTNQYRDYYLWHSTDFRNKVNARTRHVITRSRPKSITHLPYRYGHKKSWFWKVCW